MSQNKNQSNKVTNAYADDFYMDDDYAPSDNQPSQENTYFNPNNNNQPYNNIQSENNNDPNIKVQSINYQSTLEFQKMTLNNNNNNSQENNQQVNQNNNKVVAQPGQYLQNISSKAIQQRKKEELEYQLSNSIVDLSQYDASSVANLFRAKMIEILTGAKEEVEEVKELEFDDNGQPIVELDDPSVGTTIGEGENKNQIEEDNPKRKKKTNIKIVSSDFNYNMDENASKNKKDARLSTTSVAPTALPAGFKNTKYTKRTPAYWRFDTGSAFSLFSLIYILGVLYFMYFVYTNYFSIYINILTLEWLNLYSFVLLPLLGFVISVLLHDLFQHILAFLTGYRVLYFKFFGFTFFHSGKKTKKLKFSFKDLLSFRHEYVPRRNNIKANPTIMFLFSRLGQLVFFGLLWYEYYKLYKAFDPTVAFWADQNQTVIMWMILATFLYALPPYVYQIIPIKQKNKTDIFKLFQTIGANDKVGFNLCAINLKKEETGEDFIFYPYSCNLQNYYQFYAYFYTYLYRLYNIDYKNARVDLHNMKLESDLLDRKDRHLVDFERSFIRYLYLDPADAEVIYAKVKKGRKKLKKVERLSDYHSRLSLIAHITQDGKRIISYIETINNKLPYYPVKSNRTKREYQFISFSLKNVSKLMPTVKFPNLIDADFKFKNRY